MHNHCIYTSRCFLTLLFLVCAVNIGKVLLRKCDYDGAKEQFCMALDIYNNKLPEGHPKITAATQHLDRVEQEEALCV